MHERDSVLFDQIEYSWGLLAGLMWVAAQTCGKLNLIDFGGSLGSVYFQNRKFLSALNSVSWNIVEQKHYVDIGIKKFKTEQLNFFYDIESCLAESRPEILLFSSVIQYLENPYEFLKNIRQLEFDYIFFNRTFFVDIGRDILTIQKVSPRIYQASYPCWFFDTNKFRSFFSDCYELIAEFDARGGGLILNDGLCGIDKGLLFRKIS